MEAVAAGYRKPLVGTNWAISFLLCTNMIRKYSSHIVGACFWHFSPLHSNTKIHFCSLPVKSYCSQHYNHIASFSGSHN